MGDKLNYVFRVYEIREYIGNLECFTAWTKRMWYAECGMRDERWKMKDVELGLFGIWKFGIDLEVEVEVTKGEKSVKVMRVRN